MSDDGNGTAGQKKDGVNHNEKIDVEAKEEQQQTDGQKQPQITTTSKSKRHKTKDKDAGKKELKKEPTSTMSVMNMLQSGGNVNELTELAKRIQIIQASTSTAAKDPIEAKHHTYQFWQTQPVPAFGFHFPCYFLIQNFDFQTRRSQKTIILTRRWMWTRFEKSPTRCPSHINGLTWI